jgi:hypothetical protein
MMVYIAICRSCRMVVAMGYSMEFVMSNLDKGLLVYRTDFTVGNPIVDYNCKRCGV